MRIFFPYIDFYVPKHKYEYVNYFHKQYPKASVSKFERMKFEQLQAIYYAIRTRRG